MRACMRIAWRATHAHGTRAQHARSTRAAHAQSPTQPGQAAKWTQSQRGRSTRAPPASHQQTRGWRRKSKARALLSCACGGEAPCPCNCGRPPAASLSPPSRCLRTNPPASPAARCSCCCRVGRPFGVRRRQRTCQRASHHPGHRPGPVEHRIGTIDHQRSVAHAEGRMLSRKRSAASAQLRQPAAYTFTGTTPERTSLTPRSPLTNGSPAPHAG